MTKFMKRINNFFLKSNSASVDILPDEILLLIFQNLQSIEDLINCAQVNKAWYQKTQSIKFQEFSESILNDFKLNNKIVTILRCNNLYSTYKFSICKQLVMIQSAKSNLKNNKKKYTSLKYPSRLDYILGTIEMGISEFFLFCSRALCISCVSLLLMCNWSSNDVENDFGFLYEVLKISSVISIFFLLFSTKVMCEAYENKIKEDLHRNTQLKFFRKEKKKSKANHINLTSQFKSALLNASENNIRNIYFSSQKHEVNYVINKFDIGNNSIYCEIERPDIVNIHYIVNGNNIIEYLGIRDYDLYKTLRKIRSENNDISTDTILIDIVDKASPIQFLQFINKLNIISSQQFNLSVNKRRSSLN